MTLIVWKKKNKKTNGGEIKSFEVEGKVTQSSLQKQSNSPHHVTLEI